MDGESGEQRPRKRQATLFDAVAGRVGYEGFLQDPSASHYRDTKQNSSTAVPPDEVLFRQKHAPDRFAENDSYRADRHLPNDQPLPDSDLLQNIHSYASSYYSNTGPDHGDQDFRSLDETALLAIAILIQEAAALSVGQTGDLAFVRSSDQPIQSQPVFHQLPATRHVMETAVNPPKRRRRRRSTQIEQKVD